ncbi:Ca(2+)-dependent cysteine protease [Coelomomyces lativittatus]|nr:Ca(2+)-dependent cysteine protease [Coelomomyces lativittatus]KAJ1512480.1 Ca(2+)-dependent cysteine protease [Coelomomyces lativittatus]KAJ1516300.1 Ca(2+)-dependent cysteine protease [Coelomomyces lativittatus]
MYDKHSMTLTTTPSTSTPLVKDPSFNPSTTKVLKKSVAAFQGKKKALLIGINYTGTEYSLKGCFHDIMTTRTLLMEQYGFQDTPDHMQILSDVGMAPTWQPPTRRQMIHAIHWLVQGTLPGDSLVFHYSGHGGSMNEVMEMPSSTCLPEDNADVIVPVDAEEAGIITYQDLHTWLITQIPAGAKLTLIFDSCHHGVFLLGLPWWYGSDGTLVYHRRPSTLLRSPSVPIPTSKSLPRKLSHSMLNFFLGRRKSSVSNLGKGRLGGGPGRGGGGGGGGGYGAQGSSPLGGQVLMFVGQRLESMNFDEVDEEGAMSWTLNMVLKSKEVITYGELLKSMKDIMQTAFHQSPQLGSYHSINLEEVFSL